jgi:surface protein
MERIDAMLTDETRVVISSRSTLRVATEEWCSGDYDVVAKKYGCPIGNWDVGQVANFSSVFMNNRNFNDAIGRWDVGRARNLDYMFTGATSFNQDIGNWNVENVISFEHMFEGATSFNQDIGNWNVENAGSMESMFEGATSFDQDIDNWAPVRVVTMDAMFRGARQFSCNLSIWETPDLESMDDMLDGSGVDPDDGPNMRIRFYTDRYDNFHEVNWPVGAEVFRENRDGEPVFDTDPNWNHGLSSSDNSEDDGSANSNYSGGMEYGSDMYNSD